MSDKIMGYFVGNPYTHDFTTEDAEGHGVVFPVLTRGLPTTYGDFPEKKLMRDFYELKGLVRSRDRKVKDDGVETPAPSLLVYEWVRRE